MTSEKHSTAGGSRAPSPRDTSTHHAKHRQHPLGQTRTQRLQQRTALSEQKGHWQRQERAWFYVAWAHAPASPDVAARVPSTGPRAPGQEGAHRPRVNSCLSVHPWGCPRPDQGAGLCFTGFGTHSGWDPYKEKERVLATWSQRLS